jgi:hypothetical protein
VDRALEESCASEVGIGQSSEREFQRRHSESSVAVAVQWGEREGTGKFLHGKPLSED